MADNDTKIDMDELRKQSESELRSMLAAKHEQLHKLQFKHALRQLQGTHSLKLIKRDIARLNTVVGEKAREKKS